LELRYLDMMAQLSSEALVRDQPEKAVDVLRRALSIDPMRDDFNYGMLDALGRLGRVSEVVTHYEQYTSLLRQELGIEPPEPTRKLYSRIIR
jgi:DNA-binding SARP family transcriptional activator